MYKILALLIILTGCPSVSTQHSISGGTIEQDVHMRFVGSFNQEDNPFESLNLDTSVSVSGLPIPLQAIINKSGASSIGSIHFDKVNGNLILEVIGTGNQNSGSHEIKSGSEHINIGQYEPSIDR